MTQRHSVFTDRTCALFSYVEAGLKRCDNVGLRLVNLRSIFIITRLQSYYSQIWGAKASIWASMLT